MPHRKEGVNYDVFDSGHEMFLNYYSILLKLFIEIFLKLSKCQGVTFFKGAVLRAMDL